MNAPSHTIELPVAILGTHSVLPGRRVTTAEVLAELGRPGDAARWEERTGIRARHWVEPGAPLAPTAAEALRGALDEAGLRAADLRRIILVYSGQGDLAFPATANAVAAQLGLSGSCDAFDLKNACMGFLSALDVAARSVATGLGPVGIVVAEITSRGIRPSEHRPYLIFGDAVAAAVVGPARSRDEGIVATFLANDGSRPRDVFGEEPGRTDRREYIQMAGSSAEIAEIATRALGRGVAGLLERAKVDLHEIEWVLVHQPNGVMLDMIIDAFGIDPARTIRVVDEIGSVAAAAIPFSLDRLRRTRPLRGGDRILMMGVGGGVSYGATLYRIGGGP